jgi:integrase
MKKKALKFKDFYQQMISQKRAYETSEATMARIETIWRLSIAPFWKDIEPKEVNQQLVIDFINWHKDKRKDIQFVNVFKYLGNIINVMVESGALEISRKPKLEIPINEQKHHGKQKGRYITDDEFKRILSHSEGWFKLFLLIAYTTGMRKMEIGKLSVARLHLIDGHYIAILDTDNTKTGNARQVPFPKMLNPFIEAQLKLQSKYLFPMPRDLFRYIVPQYIDKEWAKAKKAAGIIGRMREHDIRHTCASNMAKDGINPVKAVTMLGMSLAMYQKTYLKLTPEDLFVATDSGAARLEQK